MNLVDFKKQMYSITKELGLKLSNEDYASIAVGSLQQTLFLYISRDSEDIFEQEIQEHNMSFPVDSLPYLMEQQIYVRDSRGLLVAIANLLLADERYPLSVNLSLYLIKLYTGQLGHPVDEIGEEQYDKLYHSSIKIRKAMDRNIILSVLNKYIKSPTYDKLIDTLYIINKVFSEVGGGYNIFCNYHSMKGILTSKLLSNVYKEYNKRLKDGHIDGREGLDNMFKQEKDLFIETFCN